MRVIPIAASVFALGAILGGVTTSSDAPETVQQHTAMAPFATVASDTDDNNGNG